MQPVVLSHRSFASQAVPLERWIAAGNSDTSLAFRPGQLEPFAKAAIAAATTKVIPGCLTPRQRARNVIVGSSGMSVNFENFQTPLSFLNSVLSSAV